MFKESRRITARLVPLALGLGLAGAAIGAGEAGSSSSPLACEIRAASTNGMVSLEGVVRADVPLSGSYRFRVASAGGAGGSNIQQGGGFAAGPGGDVTLGRVMLGGGALYDATLEVTADGVTVECEERVGGAI